MPPTPNTNALCCSINDWFQSGTDRWREKKSITCAATSPTYKCTRGKYNYGRGLLVSVGGAILTLNIMAEEPCPGPAKRPKLDEEGGEKSLLLSSLGKLTEGINKVVEEGRRAYKEAGLDEYLRFETPKGVRCLFQPVPLYVDCMKAVNVRTRAELEHLWRGYYSDHAVQESVEELLGAEESYEEFVAEVDQDLQKSGDKLALPDVVTVGKQLPTELSLTEAKSGDTVCLESYWKRSKSTLFVLIRHFA